MKETQLELALVLQEIRKEKPRQEIGKFMDAALASGMAGSGFACLIKSFPH